MNHYGIYSHLADAFIQSDIQIRTIEVIKADCGFVVQSRRRANEKVRQRKNEAREGKEQA